MTLYTGSSFCLYYLGRNHLSWVLSHDLFRAELVVGAVSGVPEIQEIALAVSVVCSEKLS